MTDVPSGRDADMEVGAQGPPIGLRLKQLVLAFGAAYLGMVSLTNLINFVNATTDSHWKFLNSQNASYIASIVKVYSWPGWFDELVVLGAFAIEGIGCFLFIRALQRYRGGRTGMFEAYRALLWNIGIWFAFIMGTEFFVAYPSESPFRELLMIGLLMTLVVAIVPDDLSPTDGRATGRRS